MATATGISWTRPWQDTTGTITAGATAALPSAGQNQAERGHAAIEGAPGAVANLVRTSPYYSIFNQKSPGHPPTASSLSGSAPERYSTEVASSPRSPRDQACTSAPKEPSIQEQPHFPEAARLASGDQLLQHAASPPPFPHPYKRRRLLDPDGGSPDMPQFRTEPHSSADTPRASISSASAADGDDVRQRGEARALYQRREDAALARGQRGPPSSAWAVTVDSSHEHARRRLSTDSCQTCDRASSKAPEIARGLQTLHGQLKQVLAREQSHPGSHAVRTR